MHKEWISVNDRMPKENGRYIVADEITAPEELGGNHTEIRIMRFHEGKWHTPFRSPEWINEAIKDNITHWMPLPEPPKEEDND